MLRTIDEPFSGFVSRTTRRPVVMIRTGSPFASENVRVYSLLTRMSATIPKSGQTSSREICGGSGAYSRTGPADADVGMIANIAVTAINEAIRRMDVPFIQAGDSCGSVIGIDAIP